jgi:hypothetical protein
MRAYFSFGAVPVVWYAREAMREHVQQLRYHDHEYVHVNQYIYVHINVI